MRIVTIATALAAGVAATAPAVGHAQANQPPGAPVLLSPGDGHEFAHGEPQTFTLSSLDPNGDAYTASVTIREEETDDVVATLTASPSRSGDTARALALPPLDEGSYTWAARATDVHGAAGAESPSRRFAVGRPAVVGGGTLTKGEVTYDPPGIPAGTCAPTGFDLHANAHAAVLDAVLAAFAGPLTVTGRGTSTCEDKFFGTGPLTLKVDGEGPTGSHIHCEELTGTFERSLRTFTAELEGDCEITGFSAGPTRWELFANAIPLPPGAGFTTPLQKSTFEGGFTVRTALQ